MRVLILGAGGAIGQAIVECAAKENFRHEITAVDLPDKSKRVFRDYIGQKGFNYVEESITNNDAISKLIDSSDIVIYLVKPRLFTSTKNNVYVDDILPAQDIINSIQRCNKKRENPIMLFYASSIGVYDNCCNKDGKEILVKKGDKVTLSKVSNDHQIVQIHRYVEMMIKHAYDYYSAEEVISRINSWIEHFKLNSEDISKILIKSSQSGKTVNNAYLSIVSYIESLLNQVEDNREDLEQIYKLIEAYTRFCEKGDTVNNQKLIDKATEKKDNEKDYVIVRLSYIVNSKPTLDDLNIAIDPKIPIEFISSEQAGNVFYHLIDEYPRVKGQTFNLSGGKGCRMSFGEVSNNLRQKYDLQPLTEVKHQCYSPGYVADGEELYNILNLPCQSLEDYYRNLKINPIVSKKNFWSLILKRIEDPWNHRKNKQRHLGTQNHN